jgi:hypothetical protein
MSELTAEYLREMLDYDPETGEFRWRWRDDLRKCDNIRCAGKVAGALGNHGYTTITVNQRRYQAHRLVWLYVHGVWPANQIDHLNSDKTDNRIANLREATPQENQYNVGVRKDNSTGVAGVSWHKQVQRYRAYIMADGKPTHLGLFDTLEAAAAARAEAEIHYFKEFRRAA